MSEKPKKRKIAQPDFHDDRDTLIALASAKAEERCIVAYITWSRARRQWKASYGNSWRALTAREASCQGPAKGHSRVIMGTPVAVEDDDRRDRVCGGRY